MVEYSKKNNFFYSTFKEEDASITFHFAIHLLLGILTTIEPANMNAKQLNTFGGAIVLTVMYAQDDQATLVLNTNSSFC